MGERAPARSAALSQKAALQMPFAATTPPVKMRLERSAELVGAKPLHLLTQTALPLESPTGAFIATQTRIFQNCLFTGGGVTESSICSAAF